MAKPKARPEPITAPTEGDLLANGAASNRSITSPSDVRNLRNDHSNNSSKEPSPTSFARRRTSSLSLPPLTINHFKKPGGDYVDAVHSPHFFRDQNAVGERFKEVQDEGVYLYHETFLKPEISRRGLEEPDILQEAYQANVPSLESPTTKTPVGYKNPKWAKAGKELRIVADEFAKSKERAKLTKKANKYSQSSIQSYEQFSDLLSELFQAGSVTHERLVVLFFFCSDITIMALESNYMEYFGRLVSWTFQYIREGLSQWIASNGGWEAIVDTTRTYVDIVFKVAVIMVAGTFLYSWFRKR